MGQRRAVRAQLARKIATISEKAVSAQRTRSCSALNSPKLTPWFQTRVRLKGPATGTLAPAWVPSRPRIRCLEIWSRTMTEMASR